jgi:hypothetical protein
MAEPRGRWANVGPGLTPLAAGARFPSRASAAGSVQGAAGL